MGITRKLQLLLAFTTLLILAMAAGCTGFFVNPTLTSLMVGPSGQSIGLGKTLQMVATGTYNDGTTKNITGQCLWSSDNTSAPVGQTSGLVTAAATIANPPVTATITAVNGTLSNTATVTVCPVVTNITLTTPSTNLTQNSTVTFKAIATFVVTGSTTQQDVTNDVTWNISNTAVIASISAGSGTVLASTVGLSTTVSATLCGTTSNILTLNVTQ
jgi:trimeric autotransporter adhesin